jgi:hypothetical protein
VIHVSSSSIHGPYIPNFSSYRASKAGATKLFGLFHCEHPELFVCQIHPGLIGGTDMHSKFAHMTEGLEYDDGMLASFLICTLSCTGGIGILIMTRYSEQLPGNFIVWLLSPGAHFLNGRFVHANWDVDELKAKEEEILKDPDMYTIGLIGW